MVSSGSDIFKVIYITAIGQFIQVYNTAITISGKHIPDKIAAYKTSAAGDQDTHCILLKNILPTAPAPTPVINHR